VGGFLYGYRPTGSRSIRYSDWTRPLYFVQTESWLLDMVGTDSLRHYCRTRELTDAFDWCRVSEIARRYNVSVACWEDGLYQADGSVLSRSRLATDRVYSYVWNNVWQYGNARRAHQLANAGVKVSRSAQH